MQNRIQQLRKARGLTADDLARAAGTTKSQLGKLERGERRLSDHWASRLAPHLDVQAYELLLPPGTVHDVRFVPQIGMVSCGAWKEGVQVAENFLPTLEGGPRAFALKPQGDSMNLIIDETGYVVVDPDDTDLMDRKVYVVMNEQGETTAKRYRANPARLEPVSDNAEHKAIILGREPFTVVGRIVYRSTPM